MRMSGRAAAMGQGIVKDVASKLTETFADCLEQKLSGDGSTEAEPAAETAETKPTPVVSTPPEAGGAELEHSRDITTVLEADDVEAELAGAKAESEAEPAKASAPPPQAELNAFDIGKSVAADRVRQPKTLIGIAGIVLLVVFLLRRR
jgi:hypothetical protein